MRQTSDAPVEATVAVDEPAAAPAASEPPPATAGPPPPVSIRYRVHSSVEEAVPVKAVFNGIIVDAIVPGLAVELLDENNLHGHTFHFVPTSPEAMAAHKALFGPTFGVIVTFSGEGKP